MRSNRLLSWLLIGVAIISLVVLWGNRHNAEETRQPLARPADVASGDSTVETLNHLASQIREAYQLNEQLAKDNQQLHQAVEAIKKQPPVIVNSDNNDIENTLYDRLQQQLNDLFTAQQQDNEQSDTQISDRGDDYPIGKQSAHDSHTRLTIVRDKSVVTSVDQESDWLLASAVTPAATESTTKEVIPKPIPVYTIPENAILFDTTLLSSIIGRVPIQGNVRNPFTFDVLIGQANLAANGIEIPNISSMRMSGYAVGDGVLKCVQGWITSATFVFQDGTIHTVSNRSGSTTISNTNTQALGQLRDAYGNACIPGIFVTNAPKVLGGSLLLGGALGASQAYAQMQTSLVSDRDGRREQFVTGDHMKYLAGLTGAGAASELLDWWKERMKDSFDVVYVTPIDPGTNKPRQLSISITQEIPIDYHPQGRRTTYVQPLSTWVIPELD